VEVQARGGRAGKDPVSGEVEDAGGGGGVGGGGDAAWDDGETVPDGPAGGAVRPVCVAGPEGERIVHQCEFDGAAA